MTAKAVAGKPRPARITRPAPAAPAAPEVLRFTSTTGEVEQREPLFYIDDVEYTIPVDPSPTIGLEALHILSANGGGVIAQAMADDYVMTEMLGEDGYAALRGCKTVTSGELAQVIRIVSQKALGALEDPKNR